MVNHRTGSRAWFWVLVGVLAASGVSIAFIAMLGLFESVAFSLVWRVFVADLYLIASFAAQHVWLRRTIWVGTAVTFVLGLVAVFWRFTQYYQWADGRRSIVTGDPSSGWSPWFGFEADLEAAAHTVLLGLILLGFISRAYLWISGDRVIRAIYLFTFGVGFSAMGLGVVLILDSSHRWGVSDGFAQVAAGLLILALTAAAIVIIASVVQRNASRAALRGGFDSSASAELAKPDGAHAAIPAAGAAGFLPPAGLTEDELRVRVRKHVDDYLRERGL